MKDSYWALLTAFILLMLQIVSSNTENSIYFVGVMICMILVSVLKKLERIEEKLDEDED